MQGAPISYGGPLNKDDETELTQLMYIIIQNEKELEESKKMLAEQGDFNLMDCF